MFTSYGPNFHLHDATKALATAVCGSEDPAAQIVGEVIEGDCPECWRIQQDQAKAARL